MPRITLFKKAEFNPNTFAKRLRELRNEEMRLTQVEMAEYLGVNYESYKKWELGKTIPGFYNVAQICYKANCDMDYLIGRIDTKFHVIADVQEATGLTTKAVSSIIAMKKYEEDNPDMAFNRIEMVSALLETQEILNAITKYCCLKYSLESAAITDQDNTLHEISDPLNVKINKMNIDQEVLRQAAFRELQDCLDKISGRLSEIIYNAVHPEE